MVRRIKKSALQRSLAVPQAPRGNRGAFDERGQLGPGDCRIDGRGGRARREAAIDAGDDVLAPDEARITLDALRDELGMLDEVRRAVNDSGDDRLPLGDS